MKRLLALLFCLLMIFSLVACGGEEAVSMEESSISAIKTETSKGEAPANSSSASLAEESSSEEELPERKESVVVESSLPESSSSLQESSNSAPTAIVVDEPPKEVEMSEEEPIPEEGPLFSTQSPVGTDYVLNTNTYKFHYPSCGSVKKMKESNKKFFTGTREEVIAMGYDPCKNCDP